MKTSISILSILLVNFAFGQIINESTLKLEDIMKGDEFIGHQPHSIRWTRESKHILFDWNLLNEPGSTTHAYSLDDELAQPITPEFYEK